MAHVTNLDTDVTDEPAAGSRRHWAARINAALVPLVEIPAALIVVAEIVVLLAGILARYVFHKPIVWSDELAAILFLWLAMLGSVIAFQRGEHMRMTAIVGMLGPRARAFLDVIAVAAALAFLVLVMHPAYEFAADEVYVTTPALEIANSWRAAAPAGGHRSHAARRAAAAGERQRLAARRRRGGARRGHHRRTCPACARAEAAWRTSTCSSSSWALLGRWCSPPCRSRSPSAWRPSAISC